MHPLLRALALAAMLLVILSCGVSSQQQPQAAPATPTASVGAAQPPCAAMVPAADTQFPPNFDYPQTPTTIASWRNGRNGHATMRNHAYCLFAGLNLPVMGVPAWRRWQTSTQAFPYAGYEMQKFWTKAVAISSGPTTAQTTDVKFLHGVLDADEKQLGPNTYPSAPIVGLDRFYRKTFSQTEFELLSPCDQALLHASAYWTYDRAFMGGDSLVMIAMHIMTKEQPDWTFQSAGWHPEALNCPDDNAHRFCGDQPASTPSADESWRNYMMVTTYGMLQIPPDGGGSKNFYAPPDTKDQNNVWPVAYNRTSSSRRRTRSPPTA